MAIPRSSSLFVRNPILALPGVEEKIASLPPESREALRQVLMLVRADAVLRANESWRKHKGPMAAYWKACSVYAGHIARALKPPSP